MVTRRLRNALASVEVRVIDHYIVGKTVTSFVKRKVIAAMLATLISLLVRM
jgi:DNA repair protein RadC